MKNPYTGLPKSSFWKTGVAQEDPYAIDSIYRKKFDIHVHSKLATAGSCFAQHITRHLKKNGYNILDVEPPPVDLPEAQHQKWGYSTYSARYGNIYTVRQLLQLSQEALGEWRPQDIAWKNGNKFYDAIRPSVFPEGVNTVEDVYEYRRHHISCVKELFKNLDVFIFTLGLTEMWVHKESGTVYPSAPGTIAGEFQADLYEFKNAEFDEIIADFSRFQHTLQEIRGGKPFKVLLTVSPVPLTATASRQHVLAATVYSKAILRAVAGYLSTHEDHIDYFPSFEIVNNPRLSISAFDDNLRTVKPDTVSMVMNYFSRAHFLKDSETPAHCTKVMDNTKKSDLICEEGLLEEFSSSKKYEDIPTSCSINFSSCDFKSIDSKISDIALRFDDSTEAGDFLEFRFEKLAYRTAPLIVHLHGAISKARHTVPYFLHSAATQFFKYSCNIISVSDPVLKKSGVGNLGWYSHSSIDAINLICQAASLASRQLKSAKIIVIGHSASGLAATEIARRLPGASLLLWNPTFDILNCKKDGSFNAWIESMGLNRDSVMLDSELDHKQVVRSVLDGAGFSSIDGKTVILQEKADRFHIYNQLFPMLRQSGYNDFIDSQLESLDFSGFIDNDVYVHFGSWRRPGRNDPTHMTPTSGLINYSLAALVYSNISALCRNELSIFDRS